MATSLPAGVQPQPRRTENERRSLPRFAVSLPVWLGALRQGEPTALTRDISAGGIFFYTRSELAKDTPVEFVTALHSGAAAFPELQVRYTGKVVRIESMPAGMHGVAVQITSHEFLV